MPRPRLLLTQNSLDTASQESLDADAARIVAIFLEREGEFAVHPRVQMDYPAIDDPATSPFLIDAAQYVAQRRCSMPSGTAVCRTVVLTTYAQIVGPRLRAAGFQAIAIDMPAGPEHTAAFVLGTSVAAADVPTLYIEAVNEGDEKIRPSFALQYTDEEGNLRAGAYGALHMQQGQRYAYLSTLSVAAGMPPGTGKALTEDLLQFLRQQGVCRVDVGTQTAARFYEKMGFTPNHVLVKKLRVGNHNGQAVWSDLALLSREI